MKHYLQTLLVLSLFVAGLSLGACTNAREGGGGADTSGSASSGSSGASTTAPPTM